MGEKRRHSQVWLCTDALKAESVCELRKKEQSRRDELEN
jgi:hypothetical protein